MVKSIVTRTVGRTGIKTGIETGIEITDHVTKILKYKKLMNLELNLDCLL